MNLQRTLVEAILSADSNAIVGADKDGTIVFFWKSGAKRIFAHTSADAVG